MQVTDRGYTTHEHLQAFNLINMNGRCYDPLIGRMLSADALVQDGSYTQSYNRYSYCFNNPLSRTDPSGYQNIGSGSGGGSIADQQIASGKLLAAAYRRMGFGGVNGLIGYDI